MAGKVYYHGGEIEVRLGDVIETRVLLFWRCRGRVVYVPGVSPKHTEMEKNGLKNVGIRTDSWMIGVAVMPETNALKKDVKFVSRDPDGNFVKVMPEDHLFEGAHGRPL